MRAGYGEGGGDVNALPVSASAGAVGRHRTCPNAGQGGSREPRRPLAVSQTPTVHLADRCACTKSDLPVGGYARQERRKKGGVDGERSTCHCHEILPSILSFDREGNL